MAEQTASVTLGLNRKTLEGTIIYACRECNAPGCFSNDPSIKVGWPACYDPLLNGQPVGDTCPQCGAKRPMDKYLGELTSSMPRWLWSLVLAFKWVVIKLKTM